MTFLVTGGGGFIGSSLARRLLTRGQAVRVIDSVTGYYDPAQKRRQLSELGRMPRCEVVEGDLLSVDVVRLLDGVDVVFHLAAQPGVRKSWSDFRTYSALNIDVTQRLLEASRAGGLGRFVFASSSSVYGNTTSHPTTETDLTRPHSPYGVTKLAAELLCGAYAVNFGVPVTSLRYFTVYGPGQRPDMAIRRMIDAALTGTPFPLYGDGSQVRDFTYVEDVVDANLLAATTDLPGGTVLNAAGGSTTTVTNLLDLIGEIVGSPVPVQRLEAQPGDVERTGGNIDRAREMLGWVPKVDLRTGLTAQVEWQRTSACDAP